jgi:thioredoxin-dependent peroxiredoxin
VRDAREETGDLGFDVVGVSRDRPQAQKAFDEKFALGFPLLSDPEHEVCEAYGVWRERSFAGKAFMGILRSSFLIDEEGRIVAAWYGVKPEATVPNARQALGIPSS